MGYDKLYLAVDVDGADNLADGADAQGGEQDGLHLAAWPRGEGEGEKEEQLSQHEQVSSIFLNIKLSLGGPVHGEKRLKSLPLSQT